MCGQFLEPLPHQQAFATLVALAYCQPLFEVWLIVSLGLLLAPFEVWLIVNLGPLTAPFEVWPIVSSF